MIGIKVAFSGIGEADEILNEARRAYPEVSWVQTDMNEADLVISNEPLDTVGQQVLVLGKGNPIANFLPKLALALTERQLYLPVNTTVNLLRGQLMKEVEKYAQLKDNNPLVLSSEETLPERFTEGKHPLAVHHVHGTSMHRYAPGLDEKLSARAYRTLQRVVPGYRPMAGFGDPTLEEDYLRPPANGKELRSRMLKVEDKISALGVTLSKSTLDYSQLNLGIFTPGGLHRVNNNLVLPDDDLSYWMEWAAHFMLRGLKSEYVEKGDDEFRKLYTRTGVKADNYQGPYLNTSLHPIRQCIWKMKVEEGGPFGMEWLPALSTSGFRTQSNGAGKRRPSAVPGEDFTVLFSRAIDGDDLSGEMVASYSDLDAQTIIWIRDPEEIGGRKRIVANVSSYLNDDLLPIPSFLAQTKDAVYKVIYQQDLEILSRFVTGSDQFISFWTEGFENNKDLRSLLEKNFGISTLGTFISYICDVGETVACGDVMQYDASATWDFLNPFLKPFLSEKALKRTEEIFNSDKIGVYTDHRGEKRYYYISCTQEDHYPKWKNELIGKTRDWMSSLPSGLAITAQCGRGPVLAVLLHLLERCCVRLGLSKENIRKYINDSIPAFGSDTTWSFVAAWTNDGGDDHNLGLLILHLMTGKSVTECEEVLNEEFENYEFLKLEPETPKTNCGYRFHDDENGRCIGVSLAPERMWDNNCYPEYPKSFLGLKSSLDLYVGSAMGTPVEDTMSALADIIITDIMGLDGYPELEHLAAQEEAYLRENDGAIPARQRIALFLNIPENQLEYMYSLQELSDLAVPEEWINSFRRPLPPELSTNPFLFFNEQTIKSN